MSVCTVISDQPCLIGSLVTSIVVIIGWWVNNLAAKKRQERNERLAEENAVRQQQLAKKEELLRNLDKLDDATCEYYSGSEEKRKLARNEILAKSSRIDKIIERLEQANSDKKLYKKYTALYEAITDGSFGAENFIEEVLDEKFKRILTAKEELYSEIEVNFDNK